MKLTNIPSALFSIIVILGLFFILGSCGGGGNGGEAPSIPHWAKSYGGVGWGRPYSIQQTSNGGYIVAGYTGGDIWVIKLDISGSITWQKTYGGAPWSDVASSIQQTSDGGYIVAGRTDSFGAGGGDIWVIKLDSSSSITWQQTYGGTDFDYANSIQQTSDGGYIVAGKTESFGSKDYDFWVIKLNSSGNILWQKTYGVGWANSIQQTSDEGYIVAGETYSFDTGIDSWIIKLDLSGNILWQKTYGGTDSDYANSIQQTSDGGYIVAGSTHSFGASGGDFWVIKLNSSGNILWQKTYGEGRSYSIQQTSDEGYIVAGSTHSFGAGGGDFWVIKLNSSGNILWQKTYGGSGNGGTGEDEAYSVQQTSDGGYIVAGMTDSFGVRYDFWVLRLKSDGTISSTAPSYIGADTSATAQDTSVVPSDTFVTPVDSTAIVTTTTITGIDSNATVQTQASD